MSTGTSDEGTEANWISAAAAGRAAPVIRIKYDLKWKEPHWYYQQGSYKKGDDLLSHLKAVPSAL